MLIFWFFELVHFIYACLIYFQSLRACVSEVIQAIDDQLFKQEDLQKKKVPTICPVPLSTNTCFTEGLRPCIITIKEACGKYARWDIAQLCLQLNVFFCLFHQISVLRLIQVVRSVEKIEKILHSQNSKEANSLESRWETFFLSFLIRCC